MTFEESSALADSRFVVGATSAEAGHLGALQGSDHRPLGMAISGCQVLQERGQRPKQRQNVPTCFLAVRECEPGVARGSQLDGMLMPVPLPEKST